MKQTIMMALWVLSLMVLSCDPDDPDPVNQEELITTLIFTLTDAGSGEATKFTFTDLDGDGGQVPVVTNGTLKANTSYTATIELLDESVDPSEDIGLEVEEEGAEHQLFYVHDVPGFSVVYDDADTNGDPIGLKTMVATGQPDVGKLTIILRHEPDKSAAGVIQGDPANAGGETDIEVTFDLVIE